MRSSVATTFMLAFAMGIGTAAAAECPPGALGVSRTIAIDPSEHARIGSMQYGETLPLRDHEVVLTFDDGPLPPYTTRILDTLASECVKATFFMVGRMVRGYPSLVRRVYNEGHTIANHSQNHPFTFAKMTVDQAAQEIETAHASLLSALGDPKAISPFFRIPGLLRQNSVEQYLAAHDYTTWSVDFLADDWTHINNREVTRRAINQIEARGKGILLLHDIQPATAIALPEILKELKARGFKIVHVVPAGADRPKTVTEPEQWVVVRRSHGPQVWPRTLVVGEEIPEPLLPAPSPASFGIEHFGEPTIKIALVETSSGGSCTMAQRRCRRCPVGRTRPLMRCRRRRPCCRCRPRTISDMPARSRSASPRNRSSQPRSRRRSLRRRTRPRPAARRARHRPRMARHARRARSDIN